MTKETKAAWLVAGGMIAGFVLLGNLAQRSMRELDERRAPPPMDCGAKTWPLVRPDGASEAVPQRYVYSALGRGYRFPPEAEVIIVADRYSVDECENDGGSYARSVEEVWERGYKFRGYRRFTPAEAQAEALRERYGEAQH